MMARISYTQISVRIIYPYWHVTSAVVRPCQSEVSMNMLLHNVMWP